jgi:hypothetical protein
VYRVGHGQRGHAISHLAGDAQRLTAAGQDVEARANAQQGIAKFGAGVDEMLAVVKHQQGFLGS